MSWARVYRKRTDLSTNRFYQALVFMYYLSLKKNNKKKKKKKTQKKQKTTTRNEDLIPKI